MSEITQGHPELKKFVKEHQYVLADFHAEWCGPCKAIAPFVHDLPKSHPKLSVCTVDIDQNSDIAQAYKVRGIPMFMLYHNGVAKKRLGGADPKALEAAVKELCDM